MNKTTPRALGQRTSSFINRSNHACPTCQLLRVSDLTIRPAKRIKLQRQSSTLSHTAIGGPGSVPTRLKTLHTALVEVQRSASAHVNASRLRLALQGLESENPTIRIGVIGLNVQETAKKIARLLLADALEDAGDWEQRILSFDSSRGVIIRHGRPHNSNVPQRTPIPTLLIPSSALERLNVELLVTSINAEGINGAGIPTETLLSPAVGTPTASDGRQVTINQPVHKTLLVAKGFDQLMQILELLSATKFRTSIDRNAIGTVVELSGAKADSNGVVMAVNTASAERGLNALRQGVTHATTYEHETLASGLPRLQDWFVNATNRASQPPQVIDDLINSLLLGASTDLAKQARTIARTDTTTIFRDKAKIEAAVEDFARNAHKELQVGLSSAWLSRNWKKLSWYKLFWRVDDVGLIINDLVQNAWLIKTEKAVYEISGRMLQLDIQPVMLEIEKPAMDNTTAFEPLPAQPTILQPSPPALATTTVGPANELLATPTDTVLQISPATSQPVVVEQPSPRPMPITSVINVCRSTYLTAQITSLTTTAQQLVLRTLSISGLSAGLSAITYVSQVAPTIYEAGTIFAVGTIFALFRMQSSWQRATKLMQVDLLEEGKDAVRKVVHRMRELVQSRVEVDRRDPVEIRMLEDAQRSVEHAQVALKQLKEEQKVKASNN